MFWNEIQVIPTITNKHLNIFYSRPHFVKVVNCTMCITNEELRLRTIIFDNDGSFHLSNWNLKKDKIHNYFELTQHNDLQWNILIWNGLIDVIIIIYLIYGLIDVIITIFTCTTMVKKQLIFHTFNHLPYCQCLTLNRYNRRIYDISTMQ